MLPIVNAEYKGKSVHDHKIGIIDIGSNAVRFVVFDGVRRTPLPVYNEKSFCALGKQLSETGKLNPHGVELAKQCIARYLLLARLMEVVELHVIATAAVRDATDGAEFVEFLEKKHHVPVTVISGKREARLGALGIVSAFYQPEGLVGDLGGGSMELELLAEGDIQQQVTLPIGPLRLLSDGKADRDKIRKILKKHFSEQEWIANRVTPQFYAIGGSFRAIAKINMARHQYPLKILHHYTVSAAELSELLGMLIHMSPEEIARLQGASAKRAPSLVPAALILEQLIETAHIKKILFSACGIREGFMFEKLSPYVQADDALISSVADLASQAGRVGGYGRELFDWTGPLFAHESKSEERLRLAACILSEIAWRIQPDYRAEWIYQRVVNSSITGLSHSERIYLAMCLYHRHQFKLKDIAATDRLVEEKHRLQARIIGTAANLAYHLSGAVTGNLSKTRISLEKGEVKLFLADHLQGLMGESVKKRLDGLGEALKAAASSGK